MLEKISNKETRDEIAEKIRDIKKEGNKDKLKLEFSQVRYSRSYLMSKKLHQQTIKLKQQNKEVSDSALDQEAREIIIKQSLESLSYIGGSEYMRENLPRYDNPRNGTFGHTLYEWEGKKHIGVLKGEDGKPNEYWSPDRIKTALDNGAYLIDDIDLVEDMDEETAQEARKEINEDMMLLAGNEINNKIDCIEFMLSGFDIDRIIIEVEGILKKLPNINSERVVLSSDVLPRYVLNKIINPENIQKFLDSDLEKYLSPEEILKRMIDCKADPEVIKILFDKYGDKIIIKEFPVFGEESIFVGFEDRGKRESDAVDVILRQMIQSIKTKETHSSYSNVLGGGGINTGSYEVTDPHKLSDVLDFLEVVKDKVSIPNLSEKLKEIEDSFGSIPGRYMGRFINSLKFQLSAIKGEVLQKKE